MIRLRKGLIGDSWECLIMTMTGEPFPVDVVASIRSPEDIISLDPYIRHEICCRICEALELPADTKFNYERHSERVRNSRRAPMSPSTSSNPGHRVPS
jgi:hypothetical protein